MKTIAVLELDLETTPLGTASRAAETIDGVAVARRTVERLARAGRLQAIHVLAPAAQCGAAADLLYGTPAQVHAHTAGPAPYADYVRIARKWSLDSWRGGLGGAAAMDEYIHTTAAAALAKADGADAVFCLPASDPLVDPELADAMIEHAESIMDEMRLTFVAAPPGLAGSVFQTSLLEEMSEHRIPPSWTLAYRPEAPSPDLMFRPCCFHAAEALRHAGGRLVADTRRSLERITRCLRAGADRDAESTGRWLMAESQSFVPPLPRDVEIELTTEDQLSTTILRPRGARVGQRGPMPLDCVRRLAGELAEYDDSLVVLGGFGEPLLHPQWPEVLAILREAGIYGMGIRTNGISLDAAAIETILRHEVDVVEVTLDAVSDETYARVQGGGSLEAVVANLEHLMTARDARQQAAPLVVPQMTKCWETLDEMDAFYDGWLRKAGFATLVGYSHYGGRLENRSVVDMSPPTRQACRRIMDRCMVTADARVLVCDQDFACERPAGTLDRAGLADIWNGPAFADARRAHRASLYDNVPLCSACQEWHRP